MIISDRYQCQGLGSEMLRQLIEIASAERIETIEAYLLPSNHGMKRICDRLGFEVHLQDEMLKAVFHVP
jgi:acetyltransferase